MANYLSLEKKVRIVRGFGIYTYLKEKYVSTLSGIVADILQKVPDLPMDDAIKAKEVVDRIRAYDPAQVIRYPNTSWDTSATGVWYRTAIANNQGACCPVGMADYVLEFRPCILRANPGSVSSKWLRPQIMKDTQEDPLVQWLRVVNTKDIGIFDLEWDRVEETPVSMYWFCFPVIESISAVIKSVRPFTENFPKHSVYVCSTDRKALDIIYSKDIGTLHYPSGDLHGWPRDRTHEQEDSRDFERPWNWMVQTAGLRMI